VEQLPLTHLLREIVADPRNMPDGGNLGIYLSYMYPYTLENFTDLMSRCLKGTDMAVYESISALHLAIDLVAASEQEIEMEDTRSD